MLKLIKYLKNSVVSILLIVGLLVIQAVCDLSLPDYTSNIVNIGIQQGGVKNAAPDIIRKSEFDKLLLFVKNEDKDRVEKSYKLLDKDTLSQSEYDKEVKEYPALSNEPLYKLDVKDKEKIEELNLIVSKPILILSGIEKSKENNDDNKDMGFGMGESINIPDGVDIITLFKRMPKEQLDSIKNDMYEKLKDIPDSIAIQSAVSYVKDEYNAIGINTDRIQSNYILYSGGIMVAIALVSMAATVTVGYLGARVAAKLGRDLRGKVFRKVVSFSNTELDKFSTASLITRSTNDIQQIQMLMVMLLRVVFYAPILGLGGIIKVLNTDTSMAWIIAVAVVSILSLVIVLFGVAIPKFKAVQKLIDKVNLVTRETLTGMLVIRAFSTQKHEEKKFDKANKDLTRTNLFVNRTMSIMMPMMMLIMNCITVLIVWNGSHAVDSGAMQVGDMMAFIQYTMQIIMSFLMISMVSIMLPRASVSAGRIDEVLTTNLAIEDPKTVENFNNSKKGLVEFKNVSFKYPNAEEYVLSNITFTANPGETTAFIGSTGSGKSTLINLIPRFYDVTSGEILVDGVNVKNVSQHDLREKIGYVPQKGVLFSGTIESNLKYGGKDISKEAVKKATNIAQANEFIMAKPEGFETEISQGGTNVSGGQKQRLSIARAIAKNPEVFIFDDSFSALDFKTDAALRKALNTEISDSTILIVAQRISTILHANKIIVLDEGKIVGVGTHDELLNNCEVYKQIALSQLSKEELSNE
ncbi:ABC transporter ATP-binding protein [Clostridium septicum]|uniref:ABC transporter ATP-binding protein n=1 Tax=Clostridium septicum TaxID=1504 RepID=A0A9N7JNP3_CLOSE|nr:ABC transporter ATP-binding protein [Clostridium septicum]AYE35240.1 ABC transporter ATP-binding protein [Clostridium septicum]MDU1313662.1 ABC transporter ATP-binding protein [Clostridium septicum]QAS60634.1 ABC transporter ATP-binding protein [Clostridium septicum]UEC20109.1 ABC transporter ATP-binding protein/permease [Clostridium septicum]USS01835.1 ABC transporter ATP-binding protein/permease [Clostridium septicum]